MAEGLIQPTRGTRFLEDIGNEYFDDLLWMSFFEEEKQCNDGVVTGYKMHDVMYDLARFVAKSEYTIVPGNPPHTRRFTKICHSSVVSDFNLSMFPSGLYRAQRLLTLLSFSGGNLHVSLEKLYSGFKYLHVLDLSGCRLDQVLKGSIKQLKHLKCPIYPIRKLRSYLLK